MKRLTSCMKKATLLVAVLCFVWPEGAHSQETSTAAFADETREAVRSSEDRPYLSNLSATKDDPLFATYAAPLRRSEYIVDEGYRFKFYEEGEAIRFATDHAGDLVVAFKLDGDVRYALREMHAEPVITTSYSDLVKYHYEPFEGVEVAVFFQVYSSHLAIQDLTITNNRTAPIALEVVPLIHHPDGVTEVHIDEGQRYFTFQHEQQPDGWTKRKHDVPHVTERMNVFRISEPADAFGAYAEQGTSEGRETGTFFDDLAGKRLASRLLSDTLTTMAFQKRISLAPGASERVRLVRGVREASSDVESLITDARELMSYDMDESVRANEALYRSIPRPSFADADEEMMYWSAFSLIRQCMLPPEGKTSYNHYVYSREPTWGWGHAGQVFHESLAMLAYVFMDPESAQDSQRLYMERQWEDGYIEYRAGPYLDAMNFVNGEFTSSAPWFNYENWEIYKEVQDRDFLQDAYASGTAFYDWWIEHRDQDDDGLAEWGGHAVLESVRDAQVAVWRDVGWPSNFEAPELNAMLVQEARALAQMARALGDSAGYAAWMEKADVRSEAIQQTFWDDETGFFYYVDRADHDFTFEQPNDLKRREIIGFIPLWAGTASPEQAERLVEHLTDPDAFWRPYGIPSLAADDPFYKPTGYWNGPVWVEWQYLIMQGLLNYGYEEEARELADRVFANVIHHLKDSHTFWEFYSPDKRWAGHHQTYIWTGIVARMLIDLHRASAS